MKGIFSRFNKTDETDENDKTKELKKLMATKKKIMKSRLSSDAKKRLLIKLDRKINTATTASSNNQSPKLSFLKKFKKNMKKKINTGTTASSNNQSPKFSFLKKFKKIMKKNINKAITASSQITVGGETYSSWEDAYNDLSGDYDELTSKHDILSGNYSGDIKDAAKQLNTKAKLQNEELIPKFSVKQSKVQYQTEQISSLNYYVFYLIWIYAFLAAFFIINLFISKKTKQISLYVKLLIVLLLFLYPYYVTSLQDLLYEIGRYAGNMFYGSVYHSPDY